MYSGDVMVGIDLAFRHTGIAVMAPASTDKGYDVVSFYCLSTQKSDKKKKIFAAHDDIRCCQELVLALHEKLKLFKVKAIAAETPHGGAKGARASRTMGMATAMLASYVALYDIPTIWVLPDEIKKKVGGKGNASKEDIQRVVMSMWPGAEWPKAEQEKQLEHVADAVGALLVARSSEIYKMVLRNLR